MADYIIVIDRAFEQPVKDALIQAGCVITNSSADPDHGSHLWNITLSTDALDEASIETLVLEVNRGSYFDIADDEPDHEGYDESEDFEDEEMAEFDDDDFDEMEAYGVI